MTVNNKYSLPFISSAFEPSIFSELDLRNDNHLVRIQAGDKWKTAFKTAIGHYEYLVIPFSLTSALLSLVNDVHRDFLHCFMFVYLDDILIFSNNLEEYKSHTCQVLQRLLENQLYVKGQKCEINICSIFLIFELDNSEQILLTPKLLRINPFPAPENSFSISLVLLISIVGSLETTLLLPTNSLLSPPLRNYSFGLQRLTRYLKTSSSFSYSSNPSHILALASGIGAVLSQQFS